MSGEEMERAVNLFRCWIMKMQIWPGPVRCCCSFILHCTFEPLLFDKQVNLLCNSYWFFVLFCFFRKLSWWRPQLLKLLYIGWFATSLFIIFIKCQFLFFFTQSAKPSDIIGKSFTLFFLLELDPMYSTAEANQF